MEGQQELEIKDSNIVKLGFIRCEDCEDEPICPHARIRRGCRTREVIKEITSNGIQKKRKQKAQRG